MTIQEATLEIHNIHEMLSDVMKIIDCQSQKIDLLEQAIYKLAEISDQRFYAHGAGGTQHIE